MATGIETVRLFLTDMSETLDSHISNPSAATVLRKSIVELLKRLEDPGEIAAINRYGETGLDPRRAVRGKLASASATKLESGAWTAAVESLESHGWIEPLPLSKRDVTWRFQFGEPFSK